MDHRTKVARMMEDLAARGVGKFTSAPPLFRLAWKLGYQVKPPLFWESWKVAFGFGVWMAVFGGVFMWFLGPQRSVGNLTVRSLVAGIIFGFVMAGYNKWRAQALKLPPWDQYMEDE